MKQGPKESCVKISIVFILTYEKNFFSDSPSEKWGVVRPPHAKLKTFCVGTFLQTEDYEVGHLTFGYIPHLPVASNFMVQCEL